MKLYEGKWLHCGNAVLVVALLGIASMVNAESSGPEPIQVPDIRANIMKMLQERRSMEGTEQEDLFTEAERQKREKDQPAAATIENQEELAKPVVAPAAEPVAASAPKPAKKAEKPVELPVKEIVIENMDDLKKLAEELRKAKQRQAGH